MRGAGVEAGPCKPGPYRLRGGVRGYGYGLGAMRLSDFSYGPIFVFFMLDCRADEGGEERMRFERLGLEFRMKLAAEEPWMIGSFDDLDVIFVWSAAGDTKSSASQDFLVVAIELVAMPMALADFKLAVSAIGE